MQYEYEDAVIAFATIGKEYPFVSCCGFHVS